MLVANTHLDAAGTNAHRAAQMRAVAARLSDWAKELGRLRPPAAAVCVAAADTNCFEVDREAQRDALRGIMAPLDDALGASDLHVRTNPDTHWFARTNETGLGHRAVSFLGRFGIDAPRRYDTLATNAPVLSTGTAHTPDSDHDLVWAVLGLSGQTRCPPPPAQPGALHLILAALPEEPPPSEGHGP